jgi:uncharacterized FAD-dependent dehydrogenase
MLAPYVRRTVLVRFAVRGTGTSLLTVEMHAFRPERLLDILQEALRRLNRIAPGVETQDCIGIPDIDITRT